MNHKFSTYVLLGIIALAMLAIVTALFTSGDIDEVCATNNKTLQRIGGIWQCGNISTSGGGNVNTKTCTGNDKFSSFNNTTGDFTCTTDQTVGAGGDGNNYSTGIFITGGTTKNITISRDGMGNISATFTDNEGTDSDTWVANYSLYYPKTIIDNGSYDNLGLSTTTYVDGQNTSQNNYILENNNSVKNWATSTFATISNLALKTTWGEVMNGTVLLGLNNSVNRSINNASIFLDANTNRVGINTYTPTERLDVSNGAIKVGYITDTFDQLIMFMRNNVLIGAIDNNAGDIRFKALNNNKVQIVDDSNNGISVNDGGEIILSNLTSANCDVKSFVNGSLYCGTDATGTGGGLENWINSTNDTAYNMSGSNTERIVSEMNTTLKANSKYQVECNIWYRTPAAATGITVNMSYSAGITRNTLRMQFPASATTVSWLNGTTTTGFTGFNATGSAGTVINGLAHIDGYITTGANAVTIIYRFKSELAAPQYAVWAEDSDCEYKKVA